MVKGTKEDVSSVEGQSGKHLADRWGLPFREPHTLSIDPAALELVDREESRRLRVLPLEIGEDGPVFAVAEPGEERFAAVRDLAGDNATFVVVAQETLDALLNSKVFSVPSPLKRPSLFRSRGQFDEERPLNLATNGDAPGEPEDDTHLETPAVTGAASDAHASGETRMNGDAHANGNGHANGDAKLAVVTSAVGAQSTEELDSLLSKITTGTGNLRAQVERLNRSLEDTQRELRTSNEQLAGATRANEAHDAVVSGLETELASLRAELAERKALNESMTARLEEVVRALTESADGVDADEGA